MPGPHVDKIYQAAQDKLYTQPMSDLQAQLATDQALAENMRRQTPEIGAEVFRDIENSNLTPQEKQEVHQKLAQYGMNQELAIPGVSTSPNTLLRGNTSYTNYSTAYLNHYAKGYVDSVRDLAMESVVKTPIPPSLVGKTNQAFLGVERVLGENLNGLPLRNSTQDILKKAGVPDDVIAKVDAAFETQGAKGTRPFDQGLQDDVDQALRQNGVDPQVIQSVNKSFNDQHAKLAKVTNLAGGQIPQQDMPDSGLLVDYLDKHGLSGGMTATDKTELAGVSVQDFQTLHQMQVDSAQRTLEASVKNLSELSPEAQGFLKSALGPIQDPTALNMAGASTLVLRLNSPGVSGDAANVKHHKDPSTSDHAIIAERGVKAVQRYVNTIGSGVNTRDYTSLGSNELHKNQTLKTQTLDSFKAVSQGQDLGNFSRSVGGPLTVSPTTRPQVDKLKRSAELGDQMNQALRAKLQPELQQIDAARAKLDKLNKPGINMEKFRAFFSKGGISGAKQATQQSLNTLQQDFNDKVTQWQKGIDKNKQDKQLKEAAQKKQQLAQKDLSVSNGEAQNLLNALNKLSGPKSQVPKDLLLTPEEVSDLQKGLKNLKKATDKKKRDSLA